MKLLEPALGPGRASVEVAATLDMTSETIQTKTYEKGQPIAETINTVSTVKSSPSGSEDGKATPSSSDTKETIENTYMLPEKIVTKSDLPGKIVSLSVAVLVDLSPPEKPKTRMVRPGPRFHHPTHTPTILSPGLNHTCLVV